MDDPGSLRLAAGELACERIDERVAACPAPGWTTSPAGLSTTTQMLVLLDDWHLGGLVLIDRIGFGGELTSSPPSSRKLFARATPSTSAPASTARSAAARDPSASARNLSRRVPAAVDGNLQRAATSSVRRGGLGWRSAATSAASRITTPTTMKLSARLNAGHHLTSMKSVTWPEPDPIEEVRHASADQQPERRRKHRMPRARACEEHEHPDHRQPAVTAVTNTVALEKSPNAMPEFCT